MSIFLLLVAGGACQKNKKTPRLVDVTSKILTERAGRFTSFNASSITFGADQKVIISKRFVPLLFFNQMPFSINPVGPLPQDIFCQIVTEMDVEQVEQITYEEFIKLHPESDFANALLTAQPIFIFKGDQSVKKSSLYEDVQYSTLSKLDSSDAVRRCEGFEPTSGVHAGEFVAQYPDENTFFAFNISPYNYVNKNTMPLRYYRSLDSVVNPSEQFVSKAASFESSQASATIRLPVNPTYPSVNFSFNKSKQTLSALFRGGHIDGKKSEFCDFDLRMNYSKISKKSPNTLPLMVLMAMVDAGTSQFVSYDFLDPLGVTITRTGETAAAAKCANEYALLNEIEQSPTGHVFGFKSDGIGNTFFIFSKRLFNFPISIEFNFPIVDSNPESGP